MYKIPFENIEWFVAKHSREVISETGYTTSGNILFSLPCKKMGIYTRYLEISFDFTTYPIMLKSCQGHIAFLIKVMLLIYLTEVPKMLSAQQGVSFFLIRKKVWEPLYT